MNINFTLFNLCTLLILLVSSFASLASQREIVLASYEYKQYDRNAALTPLAKLIANLTEQKVNIQLAASPTELAQLMQQGKGDIAMPNLIGYLEMRRLKADITAIVVPEKTPVPGKPGYTSSVIYHASSGEQDFKNFLDSRKEHTFFVVWPDSASGGLVGTSWLNENFPLEMNNLVATSTGSHDNVLREIINTPDSFGVLATNVLINSSYFTMPEKAREAWRSDEIPFGPLVCHRQLKQLCDELTKALTENEKASSVITGLIAGWPEFKGSKRFIKPDLSDYDKLAITYEQK